MKRNIKNIIMIFLIIILGISVFFTISNLKNTLPDSTPNQTMNGETPPDIPDDNQMGGDMEMPSNDNNTSMEEPPEKPDGEDNNMPDNNNMMDNNMSGMSNTSSTNTSYIYYIILIIENLLISILINYLIISNFNKKTFKVVFSNKDKLIILILSVIILTSIFTFIDIYLPNNTSINNNEFNNNNTNNESISYSSANEITTDDNITSGEYTSDKEDENAISVSGDIDVSISNITVDKTGNSNGGDNTSFYGTNSAIIAKNGANLILKNITVTTNADGANGVFSYGGSATTNNSSSDGTIITISDSKITTTKDNSGGIMTTGGGTTYATNLTVKTSGISSAAIRSDRGGGTVVVDSGTYTTTGAGSPTIYSTADISVSNATLTSSTAEGIVIEGKNSVSIDSCTLTDSNTKLNGQSTTYKNIFLYQSMSGDAASGTAIFTSKNSNIITNNGDTLYVTNTESTINLENNTIINNDSSGNFLRIQKDSWGNSGSNGGIVTLNLTKQNVTGNIVVDSISELTINMSSNSTYKGIINGDNTAKSISITLDKTSSITLTGDSYITELNNKDSSNSNINFNGYKLYVNGKSIN
jgi:hypothetical protein